MLYTYFLKPRKNRINYAILGLFTFSFILLVGCIDKTPSKNFTEGYIEYSIEYEDDQPSKYGNNLRPTKMVVKFKNNNTINKIEGLSGAFSFAFIQNLETQTNYTLVKLLNKKLFYQEPIVDGSYPFAYHEMPSLTFNFTNEETEILGFDCRKVIATYNDSLQKSFEILFTNEISVNVPNFNSPFDTIEGVMLKFSAIIFNQKMKITASNVRSSKISDDDFTIPSDYEEIDHETLKDIIALLQ